MELENRVRDAFGCVKADESLKESTKKFLREARLRGSAQGVGGRGRAKHMSGGAFRLAMGAACAALTAFLCIGSFALLGIPVAYVSIDVNPSLELELNRLDRVIAVRAYNEDGERIAAGISVKGMRYEEAIERIVDSEEMRPYLTRDAALTFTVASESAPKEAQLLSDIARSHGCREHGGVSVRADMSLVGEAHANGMSLGKYQVYRILLQYDPSLTVQDCHNMSMSQLHNMIGEHEHGGKHGSGSGTKHGDETGTGQEKHCETEQESGRQDENPSGQGSGHHRENDH
ncbi:MAG: hypothetical protein HFH93_13125 [Lachnospiraceae bacterium]|nr:hypothetical protein [Lachnospiraceae bacterium]